MALFRNPSVDAIMAHPVVKFPHAQASERAVIQIVSAYSTYDERAEIWISHSSNSVHFSIAYFAAKKLPRDNRITSTLRVGRRHFIPPSG